MRKNGMKNDGKIYIILAVLLGVLGIANVYLLIGVPILIYIGVKKIKKSKSLETKMKERAFYLYDVEKYIDSLSIISQLEEMGKSDKDCTVLKARNEYCIGNYEEFIQLLDKIPKSKINIDLDLLLKKGESLLLLKNYKESLDVFKKILVLNNESIYVISKIMECEYNIGNYEEVLKYYKKIKKDNNNLSKEYERANELKLLSEKREGEEVKG